MTGRVLDIKRLSVHDGPGIRTTVFLKGCPLRCRWCHNPESVSPEPEIGFWPDRCRGCGECAAVCPTGAHTFVAGEHRYDRAVCTACGRCVAACLPGALEFHGRDLTPAAVVAAALEDRTFYARSGGGVTLSGGEPLWQADFCAAVLALLRGAGLHTAVDTSGAVAWECFERVLPDTDLFLYDLKHTDDALHREHTGCSNREVLANLARLDEAGKPLEVRVPTIPGFNADEASMASIGEVLRRLPNLVGVRLLPYHLARRKYETVGHADTMPAVAPPDDDAIARLAAVLQQAGLRVLR